MSDKKSIFISAGDPSGDIAGFHLIEKLNELRSDFDYFGLGHGRMKQVGQEQLVDGSDLAVLGFWEVAKKYFFFRRLMNDAVAQIEMRKPAALILIDYPGFNLRLAEKIKPLGIPIIYYVSPQIWAWHASRINKIKALVDLMLLILPFETKIYDDAGVNNRFVGHYLFDDLAPEMIKAEYNPESNLIALLPGSRPQEVQRMLPTLLKTAELLNRSGEYEFAVAGVDGRIDYSEYLRAYPVEIKLVMGHTRELVRDSRLVITSSGTATLETGIIGRPMVVIYKTGMLTYMIARRLVKLDKIALINIAAGESIVPELIQGEASPEKIKKAAEEFLGSRDHCAEVIVKLNETTDNLGGKGTSERAAQAVLEQIKC